MTKSEAIAREGAATATRITSRRGVIRAGLLVLALPLAATGVWALLAPRGWYETFPGAGHNWLPSYGAFDEHLATDVGASFIALGLLLILAAAYLERRLVRVALVAYLAFEVPHLVFHLGADDVLATGDRIAAAVSLTLPIVVALVLLALTRERAVTRPAAAAGAGGDLQPATGALTSIAGWYGRRLYGAPLSPVSVWGHHPKLMLGYGAFESAVERSNRVDERLKLLGEMKAAAMVGCEWCMDFGSSLGRAEGLSEAQLRDLPRYRDSNNYSELEKAVLEFAAAMTRTPAGDTGVPVERLRSHLDDPQLVELTAVIAIENLRARFNHALGIAPQGFSEGAVCIVPERASADNGGVATPA